MSLRYDHVVFDWNGTLIDDIDLAVESANRVMAKYGKPAIDQETYRRHFRFPVQDLYRDLGFDFEVISFERMSRHYLSHFASRVNECELHPGARPLLEMLRKQGVGASILSASYREALMHSLRHYELEGYFANVMALSNQHAAGKLAEARELQAMLGAEPGRVLYIGDTTHDADIADELGWNCLLIPLGHQSREVLSGRGHTVIANLTEVGGHFRQRL